MFNTITLQKEIDGKVFKLETGQLANKANSSVYAELGGTSLLVTVVAKASSEDIDFLNLRVEYEEKFYATGAIRGNRFQRREGRPTNNAIIKGRLIDHAIRPLFPKDFKDEIQLVINVLSYDGENSPLPLSFIAISSALKIAGLPFNGPIVLANIVDQDNPRITFAEHDKDMMLNVSYVNNGKQVQAIEAETNLIPEHKIVNSIKVVSNKVGPYFEMVENFVSQVGVAEYSYTSYWLNQEVQDVFKELFFEHLKKSSNSDYTKNKEEVIQDALESPKNLDELDDYIYDERQIGNIYNEIEKEFYRDLIINQGKRSDGRELNEIRELYATMDVLPLVHGSALFNRGETQSLTIATLGSMEQSMFEEDMYGTNDKYYFHHYNFPPFSVGEIGRLSPNRRATGHGMLAEKALLPVLPSREEFPYAIRIVSEILSSNGSTSMAATCASSIALMNAGVPIKSQIGAIGIGLYISKEKYKNDPNQIENYKILTDIKGIEDFSGYMDFKMAGSRDAVTAIQMELKLPGIPLELLDLIFEASKSARLKVLDTLDAVISEPNKELKPSAPKVLQTQISKEDIGALIGPGGANIKELIEQFSVEINVEEQENSETAMVTITGTDLQALKDAKKHIDELFRKIEIGDVFDGKVEKVEGYGAFIALPGKNSGLLHVSEYEEGLFVKDMNEKLKIGDKLKVKVKSFNNGKISLTRKNL